MEARKTKNPGSNKYKSLSHGGGDMLDHHKI